MSAHTSRLHSCLDWQGIEFLADFKEGQLKALQTAIDDTNTELAAMSEGLKQGAFAQPGHRHGGE